MVAHADLYFVQSRPPPPHTNHFLETIVQRLTNHRGVIKRGHGDG